MLELDPTLISVVTGSGDALLLPIHMPTPPHFDCLAVYQPMGTTPNSRHAGPIGTTPDKWHIGPIGTTPNSVVYWPNRTNSFHLARLIQRKPISGCTLNRPLGDYKKKLKSHALENSQTSFLTLQAQSILPSAISTFDVLEQH